MDAEKGGDGGIGARHLHHDKPEELLAAAEAAVALQANAADVQFTERGQQLEREGVFGPVLCDDWRDLRLHERADQL